jgi:hypothetical protein
MVGSHIATPWPAYNDLELLSHTLGNRNPAVTT